MTASGPRPAGPPQPHGAGVRAGGGAAQHPLARHRLAGAADPGQGARQRRHRPGRRGGGRLRGRLVGDAAGLRAGARRDLRPLWPPAGDPAGHAAALGSTTWSWRWRRPWPGCSSGGCSPGMAAAGRAAMFAYVADVATPAERARYFGLLAAVGAVGTIVGPGLGRAPRPDQSARAVLGRRRRRRDQRGLRLVRCSRSRCRRPAGARLQLGAGQSGRGDADPGRDQGPDGHSPCIMFLANIGLAAFGSLYVLYVNYRFGWGPAQAGLLLMAFAAANIAAQALAAGPAVKRLGERRAILDRLRLGRRRAWCMIGLGRPPLLWLGLFGPGAGQHRRRRHPVAAQPAGRAERTGPAAGRDAQPGGPRRHRSGRSCSPRPSPGRSAPGGGCNLPGSGHAGRAAVFGAGRLSSASWSFPPRPRPWGVIQVNGRSEA